MKESYGEGQANHTGSESCGHGRKARHEALTGETAGQGESAAKYPKLQDADALTRGGRQQPETALARAVPESCAVFDPGTQGHILHGSWEIPGSSEHTGSGRIGRSKDTSR
jgi:hypothetical protein